MNLLEFKKNILKRQKRHRLGVEIMEPAIYGFLGASGAGKSYIMKQLLELGFVEVLGTTTRPPREGEVDGESYHFKTLETFDFNNMIEYAQYAGNYYGTDKKELEQKLKDHGCVLLTMEKQGLQQLKAYYGDIVKIIYVDIPQETMVNRMKKRGDSDSKIKNRLEYAKVTCEHHNYKMADLIIEGDWDKYKDVILSFLLSDKSVEIERKFILDIKRFEAIYGSLDRLPSSLIKQAYIDSPGADKRYRSTDDIIFEQTTKKLTENNRLREEKTLAVDKAIFQDAFKSLRYKVLKRRTYCKYIDDDSSRIYKGEIDSITGIEEIIVEFEFLNIEESQEFVPPSWCLKEVTDDKNYKNKQIAKQLYKNLTKYIYQ